MSDKSVVTPSEGIIRQDFDPREWGNIVLWEHDVPKSAFEMLLLFARRVLFINTDKGVYIAVVPSTTGHILALRAGTLVFSEEPYSFHWIVDPAIIPADRSVILQIAQSCQAEQDQNGKEKQDGRG